MKRPPFRALQIVSAVVTAGGFGAAAERLNISQSAVSNSVRRLEQSLGSRLFERRGRGVTPTANAQRLADAYAEAEAVIAQALEPGDRQPVVVSAAPTLAARWLAPRLNELREAIAPTELIVKSEVRLDADADIFLRHGKDGVWPGLVATPLCQEIKAPVCAPSLCAERSDAVVATLPLIAVEARPTEWDEWSALAGVPLTSRPALQFEVTSTAWEAALSGFGVALGDVALLADELAAGRLVRIGETSLQDRSYWCCVKRGSKRAPVIEAATWLVEAARSTGAQND